MKPPFQFRRLRHRTVAILALLLVLAVPQVLAQPHPALVDGVDAIGITVSDMDRAVDFYSQVLTFEKVSETEVAGDNYEHLAGKRPTLRATLTIADGMSSFCSSLEANRRAFRYGSQASASPSRALRGRR